MEKLKTLLEVRKMIALSVTLLFIVLAILGKIEGKLVEYVVVSVISYYFGKSTALDVPKAQQGEIVTMYSENTKG